MLQSPLFRPPYGRLVLVCYIWLLRDHRPDAHRLADALERLLAAVLEPHPTDVRASERTVSETSTWPSADSPAIREAMFTAPP